MEWGVVGASFRDTPMEVLNGLHLSGTRLLEVYARIPEACGAQCVVVATCNRLEIYYAGGDPALHARMRAWFGDSFAPARATMFALEDREAVVHLLRVAAGYESLVLGEDQILGQVREALAFAQREQEHLKTLGRLFSGAVAAAKRIKTQYPVSSIPLSVSYIGIKLLREGGPLAGKRALVLGAGKMSRLAAQYLLEDAVERVDVCTRSPCAPFDDRRVERFPFAERYDLLRRADVVVSATSAPHTVLEAARIPPREKPLRILDLALPYDVEPAAGEIAGVELYNMAALQAICADNARRREELCAASQGMVDACAGALCDELRRMKAERVIVHLMDRCDALTADAMSFLRHDLELTQRQTAVIERALHAALRKMARAPVRALKKWPADRLEAGVAAAEELFGLERDGEENA